MIALNLTPVQASNLRAVVEAVALSTANSSPLGVLNTGEWPLEVLARMPIVEGVEPEMTAEAYIQASLDWPSSVGQL